MTVFAKSSAEFITNILSLKFITMYSGDNAYSFFIAGKIIRFKMVFLYSHSFVYGQRNRYNIL